MTASVWALRRELQVATGLFAVGLPIGGFWWAPALEAGIRVPTEAPDPTHFAVNNLGVTLFMLAGVVLLGVTSVVGLLSNGMQLGGLVGSAVGGGADPLTVVLFLLPHGVVELPALWLAGAVGLAAPWRFVLYVTERRDYILTLEELLDMVQVAVLSMALIVVAAVLEAYLTPVVVSAVG